MKITKGKYKEILEIQGISYNENSKWFAVSLDRINETINYTRCSAQLKSVDVISFEDWKQKFVVKTETNNIYEFRGDFVLGEDLEFAYSKDVELYNSLIV